MDPQEKDEAKLRRQAALAQRMGEALDRIAARDRRECPDPEIIAAYAEDSLDSAETSKWEGHFAGCSRCRNILRVLAASADTPLAAKEVAQIGELVAAARPAAVETPSVAADRSGAQPKKVIHWPKRWLAPALGVAAALAVWFAMRPPWRATDQSTSGTLVAEAPKEEVTPPSAAPPAAQLPAEIAPQQQRNTESAAPVDRSRASLAPRNGPAEPATERDLQKALNSPSPRAGAAVDALQEEKKMDRLADGRQYSQAVPVAPAAPPPPRLAMPAPAVPQSQAKSALSAGASEAPQVTASANAVENKPAAQDKQAADSIQNQAQSTSDSAAQQVIVTQGRAGARKEQALGLARPMQKDSSLLKAPSDLIHWRAGKGGIIQRSADSGRTWVSQPSPSKEDWLAGAAFSDTVCWLAGRHGAIARTTDGRTWERIPPPAQAAAADGSQPDWPGISASDAQSAVLTAADGRRFATADGGRTWQPQ